MKKLLLTMLLKVSLILIVGLVKICCMKRISLRPSRKFNQEESIEHPELRELTVAVEEKEALDDTFKDKFDLNC